MKPALFVANVSEDEVSNPDDNIHVQAVKEYPCRKRHAEVIAVSAKLEAEIAELDDDEAKMF